jgi:hypothetical protein
MCVFVVARWVLVLAGVIAGGEKPGCDPLLQLASMIATT